MTLLHSVVEPEPDFLAGVGAEPEPELVKKLGIRLRAVAVWLRGTVVAKWQQPNL